MTGLATIIATIAWVICMLDFTIAPIVGTSLGYIAGVIACQK